MKRLLLCLVSILFISCGSYQHSSYKIKSVLAITEAGDTIAVPIKDFERNKYDSYTRFNYNNNWYWNNWRYDFNWRWQQPFFSYPGIYWWDNNLRNTVPSRGYRTPSRPKVQPKRRPRVNNPNLPRRPKPQPRTRSYNQGPRGGRSYNSPSRTPNTTRNVQPQRQVRSNYNTGRSNSKGSRPNQ